MTGELRNAHTHTYCTHTSVQTCKTSDQHKQRHSAWHSSRGLSRVVCAVESFPSRTLSARRKDKDVEVKQPDLIEYNHCLVVSVNMQILYAAAVTASPYQHSTSTQTPVSAVFQQSAVWGDQEWKANTFRPPGICWCELDKVFWLLKQSERVRRLSTCTVTARNEWCTVSTQQADPDEFTSVYWGIKQQISAAMQAISSQLSQLCRF